MKILRTCPICGKKFNPCCTGIKQTGVFNWREVACSFQCGKEYLQKIEKEQSPTSAVEFVNAVSEDILTLEETDIVVADEDVENKTTTSTRNKKKK